MRKQKKKFSRLFLSSMFVCSFTGYSSWIISYEKLNNFATPTTYAGTEEEVKPVAYIVGKESVKYTSIEKALSVATSGEIVTVIPPSLKNYNDLTGDNYNIATPDQVTYTIRRNCEIKAGVSLVFPTDQTTFSSVTDSTTLTTYISSMEKDDGTRGSTFSAATYGNLHPARYLRTTIDVADGVTLTNNGNLIVSGYLSGGTSGAGTIGQTSYSYSQIIMGINSKIVQSNSSANTYCFGYISERSANNGSSVSFESGSLYIPLIITDYKGFSFSWAMTNGAINTNRCSPFNQMEFRNIDSTVNISYNSSVYAIANFYVKYDTMSVNEHFLKTISLVGNTSSFFVQLNNTNYSSLTCKFDKSSTIEQIKIYGGMILNNMELKIEKSPLTVDLSTTNAFFPLSYHQNISLLAVTGQTSATFDITKQRVKCLPGSSISVDNSCTLKATELISYSSFYDGSIGNGKSSLYMGGSISYPLKEGATISVKTGGSISATNLAGTIYGDSNSISYTGNKTITSKEAWQYKSSGSYSPAWTIGDYLEIHEELNVVPYSYLADKKKIFAATSTFTNYNSFLPAYQVIANDSSDTQDVSTYQKVLFYDSITNYKINFINNIYKAYNYNTFYEKDATITYNSAKPIFGVINSVNSISNNSSGTNEFYTQSISISCSTPEVDGKVPLYVGKSISLVATLVDSTKIYNPVVTWSSSDSSVATVDQSGNVTGVKLGTTTITAKCDGITATYLATVIEAEEIVQMTSITITDADGKSSAVVAGSSDFGGSTTSNYNGQYSNGAAPVFTANIIPTGAPYKSILWTFSASGAGRQYVNDKTLAKETVSGQTTIAVHIVSGSGASDDKATLKCSVTDLNGKAYSATFVIDHKADAVCLLPDTLITMADGTYKKAIDVHTGDMAMAFNHEKGIFCPMLIIGNDHITEPARFHNIMNLFFSDGSQTRIAFEHGFFDIDLNKYVYLSEANYQDYLGHRFYGVKSNKDMAKKIVILDKVVITRGLTKICSPVTAQFFDIISDNMLSMAGGLKGLFNIFEYNPSTLQFDQKKKQADIKKYGLLSYSDFKDFFPKQIYDLLPCQYLGISIEKGLLTWEVFKGYVKKWGDQLKMNM